VHVNHRLRETAGRDEAFSVGLAESFGWRIVVVREDAASCARRERRSLEDAARTVRYRGFDQARAALGADVVALGHTRDDQAETVLLRLLRGAGPTGLAGMHPRRGAIVRPLLSCRRAELRQFLTDRGAGWVDDESNADVRIPRNRVRAELLPFLEQAFNPAIVDVLADEGELAREIWMWMEESLKAGVWSPPTLESGAVPEGAGSGLDSARGVCERALDVNRLLRTPLALRRFVVWQAMKEAAGRRPVSFAHTGAVLALLDSETPCSLDLPGHSAQRLGSRLVLRRGDAPEGRGRRRSRSNLFDYPLSIPGEVLLPQAGCVLVAGLPSAHAVGEDSLKGQPDTAVVRRDARTGSWRVRNRRPGDRFRPIGLGGRKKLQDFFVDRKVPSQQRDLVPLVVDEHDRIVWVAGFGIDEAFRVTDPAQGVVMLQLKKYLGGSA
jgi:tRNA(Ile)-lysidine synthase